MKLTRLDSVEARLLSYQDVEVRNSRRAIRELRKTLSSILRSEVFDSIDIQQAWKLYDATRASKIKGRS